MSHTAIPARLSRSDLPEAALPPERIVHLGLGAFHRAHQAWYTARAADAGEWGIVAFSGRSHELAQRLTEQQGLYTLVQRDRDGDRFELIGSIVRAEAGDDVAAFLRALGAPSTAVLTITITEVAYRLGSDGSLDLRDPTVQSDLTALTALFHGSAGGPGAWPVMPLARVLLGLDARRLADAPTIALVSCDNLPDNGSVVRRILTDLARATHPVLAGWLETGVSVVSTSVDRITPHPSAEEVKLLAAELPWGDAVPVVTEPFSDWVLSGDFPAGRPAWETSGARFVDEIAPWEHRKLWMLNGAHTLLAPAGRILGHRTVSDAITDPTCRRAVEAFWDEAQRHLPDLEIQDYREALVSRFSNPRIEHRLSQISQDGLTKVQLRIVPIARRERATGRSAEGCAAALGAWIAAVMSGIAAADASTDEAASRPDPVLALLTLLDSSLADDADFADAVRASAESWLAIADPH